MLLPKLVWLSLIELASFYMKSVASSINSRLDISSGSGSLIWKGYKSDDLLLLT